MNRKELMGWVPEELPGRLRSELDRLRPLLASQGYLQKTDDPRRGRYWQLRYIERDDTGRHRRGLYVGNDDRAAAVRKWLQDIRGEVPGTTAWAERKATESLAAAAGDIHPILGQAVLRLWNDSFGGGPERRGRPCRVTLW